MRALTVIGPLLGSGDGIVYALAWGAVSLVILGLLVHMLMEERREKREERR